VGGLGATFLLRRARSSWLLLVCVVVMVLLATGLAAVLWTFAARVVPAGALSSLAAPQGRSIELNGLGDQSAAASDTRLIRATLNKSWPGVSYELEGALWSGTIQISSPTTSTGTAQLQPASLQGIESHATLTAGAWPGPPQPGGPLPVALPEAVAGLLHLASGSTLTGTPHAGGARVTLKITGVYRASDPSSTYWGLDLLPVGGISVKGYNITYAGLDTPGSSVTYGPAVVNPAAFGGTLTASEASWLALPQAQAMAQGNVAALAANTSAAATHLTVAVLPYGLTVTSRLPALLTGIASNIVLTRSLFTIAALMLLLVAGAGLLLAARLLASLREQDAALLRARGANSWQLTRPVLAEAVALATLAALAGVLAGTRVASVLASLGHLHLGSHQAPGITPLAWLSALVMLVLCVAVMTWPALRSLTPDAARRRHSRQARLAGIAWAGGDLAVVALAAVAVWQLRGYSAVAHPAGGSLGIDPVVAVAPALALAGVALIPLRGLPLLARLADLATDAERRLAGAMVSWQIARRPIRQAGPVLLVVVATATTTLALAGYASWRQSAADQAAFAVGSDVRVDSGGPLSPDQAGALAHAPGVSANTAASLAGLPNGGQLIALDASTAGKTILMRPDLSSLPLRTLWRRITPKHLPGVALAGRPERLEVVMSFGGAYNVSSAEIKKQIGSAQVQASVQDASGMTYQIPASGPLLADGRLQSLTFTLSGSRNALYPLRVLGLQLSYVLPPYNLAQEQGPVGALTVKSFAVSDTASGPFGPPFGTGTALNSWMGSGYARLVPTGPPSAEGGFPPSDGLAPAPLRWRHVAGGAYQLTFLTGHDPSVKVEDEVSLPPGIATGQIGVTEQPPSSLVPAIATRGYLAANRLTVGAVATASVAGLPVNVHIVAVVADFPTVFGQNRALITDLAEVNDVLTASQALPLTATRWWLRTRGGQIPALPRGLGLSVTSKASEQAALLTNPLLDDPRRAMLAIGVAAVLLGVLGFSISVAASLRSRRTQSALFAALGVGKSAQAVQLCLEQGALSLPAAAVGLLAGIGLADLMVPAITLTAGATAPVPWVLVNVPLGPAAVLALITAAGPIVAAAMSVLRRPDPAAQLRAEAA